ncbi:SPOR domain-containing protein [Paenibacillus tarimensis]
MSEKARMTFRFEHKSGASMGESRLKEASQDKELKLHQEAADKPKVVSIFQDEMQFTQEIAPWHSPFQDDPNALEKLIREADYRQESSEDTRPQAQADRMIEIDLGDDKEYSGTEKTVPMSGGWYDGLRAEGVKSADVYSGGSVERIRRISSGPSWLKVFASVTGAIATGALFGYMVLSLFAGESVWPGSGNTGNSLPIVADSQPAVNQSDPAASITDETGPVNTLPNEPEGAAVQVELPSITYYMLQIGVFSSKEGMESAALELKEQGFAAAAAAGGDFRVYAGIAADRTQAERLTEQLTVPDVYVKAVTTPSASSVRFGGEGETLTAFFERTDQLIRLFNELTIRQLEQEKPGPIGTSWKDSHQQWTTAASAVQSGIEASGKAEYEKLVRSINTAAVSLSEYEKNPSRAHLWTTQTALMEAVLGEKAWLEQIVAL